MRPVKLLISISLASAANLYFSAHTAAGEPVADCNSNAIPDECDLDCGTAAGPCDLPGCGAGRDCNTNGVPDECDITAGTSADCQADGLPDECQIIDLRLPFTDPEPLHLDAVTDAREDRSPRVATDGLGHWVAVWESQDPLGGTNGFDRDILAARSSDNGLTWTEPAPLNNNAPVDSGDDFAPQIATDGAGGWIAVWYSADSLEGTIGTDRDILLARSSDEGETWTDPAPLNNNAATDSRSDFFPQVATDAAGRWMTVWHSLDSLGGTIGTDADILVAFSDDDGLTWSDPAPLNTNAATDSGWDVQPQVATDGGGHWVAVWQSDDDLGSGLGTDNDILVARSDDGGLSWTGPSALNTNAATDSGDDFVPQVSTDRAGCWVAVWSSTDDLGSEGLGPDRDILVARSSDGGQTWTDPAPLNNNAAADSGHDVDPQVTTDGSGLWVTVWASNDSLGAGLGTDYDALVARSSDGGVTWTDPAALNANAAADSGADEWPQLAGDGGGRWLAVWASSDTLEGTVGGDRDILAARTQAADYNTNGVPDECEPDLDSNGVPDGCEAAGLLAALPAHEGTLCRSRMNFMRLTFGRTIAAPADGALRIEVMTSNGGFAAPYAAGAAADGSAEFLLSVSTNALGQPCVLEIRENGAVLANRTWIAVRNTGDWACVAPFAVHYLVQTGDVDGDGHVLAADISTIIPDLGLAASDEQRRDVDGEGHVLIADISTLIPHLGNPPVPKPPGHDP